MLSNSICSYIPELPPNAREYPNKWNSQKWNKCGKKWIFLWRGFFCEDNNCVPSYEHYSHLYIGFQSSIDTLYFMNNGAVIHFFSKKKGKKRQRKFVFIQVSRLIGMEFAFRIIYIIPLIKIFLFIGKGQVVFILLKEDLLSHQVFVPAESFAI